MRWLVVTVVVAAACLGVCVANRRFIQGTGLPVGVRGGGSVGRQSEVDIRLGLIATELGVAPVPGGIQPGSFNPGGGGIFNPIPGGGGGGGGGFGRDESCWCQPINQPCTPLRPVNLNLVTRIINPHGTPTVLSQGGPGGQLCSSDSRQCCPGGPPLTIGVGPNQPGGNSLGHCGIRHNVPLLTARSPNADFAEYPWMVALLGPSHAYLGGAALLSPSLVITAAHKVQGHRSITVRLGEYNVASPVDHPQYPHYEVAVSDVIIHPGFNKRTLANNIALLRISVPINLEGLPHITPVCLPGQGQLFNGQRCFVAGWGKDAFTHGSHQSLLQEVDVPVIDGHRCEQMLRHTRLGHSYNLDKRSFICAGGEQDKDACQGDGGSPLVCQVGGQWTLAGMVAWGVGCAQLNVPGVYVNVASYADFIRQYMH